MGYPVTPCVRWRRQSAAFRGHRRLRIFRSVSGQLERRALQRSGPDGGGAGHFRALESACTAYGPRCCSAARASLGPALQAVGVTTGYYLYNAAPYVLTLVIMIAMCRPDRTLAGAPGELSLTDEEVTTTCRRTLTP